MQTDEKDQPLKHSSRLGDMAPEDHKTLSAIFTQKMLQTGIERKISLAFIPLFLVVIGVLVILDLPVVFEPPFLLAIMNSVFLGIIPFSSLTSRSGLCTGVILPAWR